jgi:catechol-2,3-dioxygenase
VRCVLYHFGLKIGKGHDEPRVALVRLGGANVPIVKMFNHAATKQVYLLDPGGNQVKSHID